MQRQPCIHTAELPAGPRAEFIDLCARIGADARPATARTCDLACLHVRRQDLGGLQRRLKPLLRQAAAAVLLVERNAAPGISLPVELADRCLVLAWPPSGADADALLRAFILRHASGTPMSGHEPMACSPHAPSAEALAHAGISHWEWSAAADARRLAATAGNPLAGLSVDDLVAPADAARDRAAFEDALRGATAYRSEVDFRHPVLGLRRFLLTGVPRIGSDGTVVAMAGIAQDVTAVEARQPRIEIHEQLFSNWLKNGQMYCWEWDLETGVRSTLGPSQRILGMHIDAIEQAQVVVHPDDRAVDEALVARAIRDAVPYENEFRVIRPDGRVRWIHSRGEVAYAADGKAMRLSGSAMDVTEQRDTLCKLQDSGRRLGLALRAARLNPWSVDLVNEIHTNGPLDIEFFGEPLTSRAAFVRRVHPEDRALVARMRDANFLRSQRPEEFTFRINHADGSQHWIRSHAQGVCDAAGTPIQIVGVSKDITEVHATTERLKRTQHLVDRVQSASNMALWEWSAAEGIRYFREGGRILEAREMPVVHPDDTRRVARAIVRTARSGRPYEDQFRIIRPSGAMEWVKIQASVSRDERTAESIVSGVLMDITQQHHAAEKLASTQRRLVRAMEASRMFDWELGIEPPHHPGAPLPIDPAANIFGRIHPADLRRHEQELTQALNGPRGQYRCELRVQDRTGEYSWLLITGQRELDDAGRAIGLSGIAMDISGRKAVESMLIESREWQRLAVGAADLNLWRIDLGTGHRYGGDRDWRMYGRSPDSISELMRFIHGEDLPVIRDALNNAVRAGVPYQIEYRLHSEVDGMRWIRDRGEVVDSSQNGGRYLVGVSMDITDQRNANDELHRALSLAHEASEAKSGFLAAMSHELRTPLNAVLGFSNLLQVTDDPKVMDAHLHALNVAAHQLMSVINNVLDFSRIEASALKLERARFSLGDCITGAMDMVAGTAEEKNLCLMFVAHDAGNDQVLGDATRVRQIALNLISNAVKFTDQGAVRASLGIFRAGERTDVVFGVADTGIGMSPRTLERLFEPFRQGDESTVRRFAGSGLGLSICRRLVEMMDGTIEVESTPDVGTRFLVRFSLDAAEPAAAVFHRPLGAQRIGVCVRSEHVLAALRDQLREYGAEVVEIPPAEIGGGSLALAGPLCALVVGAPLLPLLSGIADWPSQASGSAPLPIIPLVGIDTPLSERTERAGQRVIPIHRALKPRQLLNAVLSATRGLKLDDPGPAAGLSSHDPSEFDGVRVMVVEDNEINRTLLALQLESLGIACLLAEDGHEAMSLYAWQPSDIILMDIEMPGIDGMQTTVSLFDAIPHGQPRPYVVAVTAHVFGDTRERMRQAGMHDFISKPVVMDELVGALRRGVRSKAPAAGDGTQAG